MKSIGLKEVNSCFSQVVSRDVHFIEQHLDEVLAASDLTLFTNLIEETELVLEQAKDSSTTYRKKYEILERINQSWFSLWKKYKDDSKAAGIIEAINHVTNYSIAYSYLFLSLTLINEDRTGDYTTDLKRIVSGFQFLSQIVDIFLDLFSSSELDQIRFAAQNALSISHKSVYEYFEDGVDLSNLITNLRAYSSLIIVRVKERTDDSFQKSYAEDIEYLHGDSNEESMTTSESTDLRPFGLCAGEFIVPDDFDESLPEDILTAFEGR